MLLVETMRLTKLNRRVLEELDDEGAAMGRGAGVTAAVCSPCRLLPCSWSTGVHPQHVPSMHAQALGGDCHLFQSAKPLSLACYAACLSTFRVEILNLGT